MTIKLQLELVDGDYQTKRIGRGDTIDIGETVAVEFCEGAGRLNGKRFTRPQLDSVVVESGDVIVTLVIPAMFGALDSSEPWTKEIRLKLQVSQTGDVQVSSDPGWIPWVEHADRKSFRGSINGWLARKGTVTHDLSPYFPWDSLGFGDYMDKTVLEYANFGLFERESEGASRDMWLYFVVVPVGKDQQTHDEDDHGTTLIENPSFSHFPGAQLFGQSLNMAPVINVVQVTADVQATTDWKLALHWRWHNENLKKDVDIRFSDICNTLWNPTVLLGRAGLKLTRDSNPWLPVAEISMPGGSEPEHELSTVLVFDRPGAGAVRLRSLYPYLPSAINNDDDAYTLTELTIPWQSEPSVPKRCKDEFVVPKEHSTLHAPQTVSVKGVVADVARGVWSKNEWSWSEAAFPPKEITHHVTRIFRSTSALGDGEFRATWEYHINREVEQQNWVQLGAFDIRPSAGKQGHVTCTLKGVWDADRCDLLVYFELSDVECDFRIGAGTDLADRETNARFDIANHVEDQLSRESAPMIKPGGQTFSGKFSLRVDTERGRDAVIECKLERKDTDTMTGNEKTFYLHPKPFMVAYMDAPDFNAESTGSGSVFGYWRSDDPEGPQWRVPDSTISFLLAPQAVGEEMERGKRFGISPLPEGMEQPATYIEPGAPIRYRFSPPTSIVINPSLVERRYHPVPNNLSKVLQRARVMKFSTEMVYQLGIDFERDNRNQPEIHIAETDSFTGCPTASLPPLLEDGSRERVLRNVFPDGLGVWANQKSDVGIMRQYRRLRMAHSAARANFYARVAQHHLFDPYTPDAQLALDRQLEFTIRANAGLTPDSGGATPPLMSPLPTYAQNYAHQPDSSDCNDLPRWKNVSSDQKLSDDEKRLISTFLKTPASGNIHDYEWGDNEDGALRAGILHTIEFKSELLAVLRSPRSRSGVIDKLSFSALGATGSMAVEFNEGKTTFIADVRDGQVERLVKITIGRLGCVWNRCKHTIVYERTVAPSEQFWKQQHPALGRPLIRKTEEYIEPLEPVREFDRENDAASNSSGCLSTFEVATPRIYVDGGWGRELGHGYEIPLWNPADSSGFYPKPELCLHAVGAAGGRARQWIQDPNELVFYANMQQGASSDTDKWEPESGVDAPIGPHRMPLLTRDKETTPEEWSRQLNGNRAASARADAGRRPRFDLRVVSEAAANLQARRGRTEMLAKLESVSIMRSSETSACTDKEFKEKFKDVAAITDAGAKLDRAFAEVRSFVDSIPELILKSPCERAKANLKSKLKEIIDNAKADINKIELGDLDKIKTDFSIKQAIADEIGGLGITTVKAFDRALHPLQEAIRELRAAEEAVRKKGHSVIDMHWQPVAVQLRDLDHRAKEINASLQTLREQLTTEAGNVKLYLEGVIVDLNQTTPAIEEAITKANSARQRLEKIQDPRFTSVLKSIQRGIRQLTAFLEQHKSVGDDELVRAARNTCSFAVATVMELDSKLHGISESVRTQLHPTAWADTIKVSIDKLLSDGMLTNDLESLEQALKDVGDVKHGAFTKAVSAVQNSILELADNVNKKVQGALNKLTTDVKGTLSHGKSYVKQQLDSLECEAITSIDEIGDGICDAMGEVESKISDVLRKGERKLREEFSSVMDEVVDEATTRKLDELAKEYRGTASKLGKGLKLAKSVSEMPKLPQLTFNIDSTECVFDDVKNQIETSPFVAKLKELEGGLNELGLSIPSERFSDLIDPAEVKEDFYKIFNNICGADCSYILKQFKLPTLNSDVVKVTHGVDKKSRSAWAKAIVHADYPEEKTAFDFAGLAVRVSGMSLRAKSELQQSLSGGQKSTTDSAFAGNWSLDFGGTRLVTFSDVTLRYDGYDFDFDLNPDKVQLHPSLQFISEIAEKWGEKVPPMIEIVKDARGLPTGARANLETVMSAPPPLGPVTIGPLRIGGGIGLTVAKEFELAAHVFVGRKQAPVFVQIGWLGGGLWLEARARLIGNEVVYASSVGMALGSTQSVTVAGIARGSYSFLLYTYLEMSSPGASALTVGMSIMGSARLLGVASIYVSLLLEVMHRSGGQMTGRGVIEAEVEICWCFTLRVNESVEQDL